MVPFIWFHQLSEKTSKEVSRPPRLCWLLQICLTYSRLCEDNSILVKRQLRFGLYLSKWKIYYSDSFKRKHFSLSYLLTPTKTVKYCTFEKPRSLSHSQCATRIFI